MYLTFIFDLRRRLSPSKAGPYLLRSAFGMFRLRPSSVFDEAEFGAPLGRVLFIMIPSGLLSPEDSRNPK